jgi:hypothetical protein
MLAHNDGPADAAVGLEEGSVQPSDESLNRGLGWSAEREPSGLDRRDRLPF